MRVLCEYVHTSLGTHRGLVSDLELLVVLSHLAWVLELNSSTLVELCVLLNAELNFQPPFVPLL